MDFNTSVFIIEFLSSMRLVLTGYGLRLLVELYTHYKVHKNLNGNGNKKDGN